MEEVIEKICDSVIELMINAKKNKSKKYKKEYIINLSCNIDVLQNFVYNFNLSKAKRLKEINQYLFSKEGEANIFVLGELRVLINEIEYELFSKEIEANDFWLIINKEIILSSKKDFCKENYREAISKAFYNVWNKVKDLNIESDRIKEENIMLFKNIVENFIKEIEVKKETDLEILKSDAIHQIYLASYIINMLDV